MSQEEYLPQKRNISPWHGMTKEQSGNITVTTVTYFAANHIRTTYSSNVRCMLIILSQHKTNIPSFKHIRQKYGRYFKSKCKPLEFKYNLTTIKYCSCIVQWVLKPPCAWRLMQNRDSLNFMVTPCISMVQITFSTLISNWRTQR